MNENIGYENQVGLAAKKVIEMYLLNHDWLTVETQLHGDTIMIIVQTESADYGKIIGKKARNLNALNMVVDQMAYKKALFAKVMVKEALTYQGIRKFEGKQVGYFDELKDLLKTILILCTSDVCHFNVAVTNVDGGHNVIVNVDVPKSERLLWKEGFEDELIYLVRLTGLKYGITTWMTFEP